MKYQIGVIGMATMGANLARNFADKGFKVAVYNRDKAHLDEFISQFGSEDLKGFESLEKFVESLEKPRKIILMIKAGEAVDSVSDQLAKLLDKKDIIVDGGNSFFEDTERRFKKYAEAGLNFVGMGVSGGEEGALKGPSLMPGGTESAFAELKPFLEKIAARDFDGGACVTFVGEGAAGHYVKMVHNGIEYAIMQLLAESYDLMRKSGMKADEIGRVFEKWNGNKQKSFLLETAAVVLQKKDEDGEGFLVDKLLDKAGQKGTGSWTSIEGLKRGVFMPQINSAVNARLSSSQKEIRVKLAKKLSISQKDNVNIERLEEAFFCATILAYIEGFSLMITAASENKWEISLSEICRIWEGGCIIRSTLLKEFRLAFADDGNSNILENKKILKLIVENSESLTEILEKGLKVCSLPCFSSAQNYLMSMSSAESCANLIQGMRDLFGAHTYERNDKAGIFHTKWTND